MKYYELARCVTFEEAQVLASHGWKLVAVIVETENNWAGFFFRRRVKIEGQQT